MHVSFGVEAYRSCSKNFPDGTSFQHSIDNIRTYFATRRRIYARTHFHRREQQSNEYRRQYLAILRTLNFDNRYDAGFEAEILATISLHATKMTV